MSDPTTDIERCGGCGIELPATGGPTHPYMVSSPSCWAAFGEVQAQELERFGYPDVHGIVVDCFAASHGGDGTQRRDRQSVFIHLIALCAVLERGSASQPRIQLLRRLTGVKRDWPVLPRPPGFPRLDHGSLSGADGIDEYTRRARDWAGAVWDWWEPAHPLVRAELDKAWS